MKKIGIIYGGRSTEHDASLKSKENFLTNLDSDDFEIVDLIFIDRNGSIYLNNKLVSFGGLIDYMKKRSDISYLNLLHGQEGEDGSWCGIFDICDIAGTFESVNTSSILMNKYQQSLLVSNTFSNLVIPKSYLINDSNKHKLLEMLVEIKTEYIIVKPNSMGASHFAQKLNKKSFKNINNLINQILIYDNEAIIQEFIEGEEYTCGVIDYKGTIMALPIIHVKSKFDFLDHVSKHKTGNTICDFNFFKQKLELEKLSIELFKFFNVIGMCRFDFIITGDDKIYYLEGNLIPGFSNESAFPMMLKEEKISLTDFTKSLFSAYEKRKKRNKYLPYDID